MGMSSHVCGVRDLDGRFSEMLAIKLACEKAKVSYPQEVKDYFKYPGEAPDHLRLAMEQIDIKGAVREYSMHDSDVFDVDLTRLPSEVKIIRFSNSY